MDLLPAASVVERVIGKRPPSRLPGFEGKKNAHRPAVVWRSPRRRWWSQWRVEAGGTAARDARQQMNFPVVTRLLHVTWRAVARIARALVVGGRLDPQRRDELYEIGLDEANCRKRHEYLGVIAGRRTGDPVWLDQEVRRRPSGSSSTSWGLSAR